MKKMQIQEYLVICMEFMVYVFYFCFPIVVVNNSCQAVLFLLTEVIDMISKVTSQIC